MARNAKMIRQNKTKKTKKNNKVKTLRGGGGFWKKIVEKHL